MSITKTREVFSLPNVHYAAGGMFSECRSIAKMELPASVNYIRKGAFSCCRSLESINMPRVTTIELSAFSLCGFKGDLVIPSTVKTIGLCFFL
ncbi:leucine-rich repeat protein [Prevotella pallens]|uniref:leucine-rich repeat protein n=1 Tax=Prevotella pallens TaxID=60133 RepID=UPI0009FD0758